MGNPHSRFTDAELSHKFSTMLALAGEGMDRTVLANRAKISKPTFYSWLDKGRDTDKNGNPKEPDPRYASFVAELESAESRFEQQHLEAVGKAGTREKKPDWKASAWILERRFPFKYAKIDDDKILKRLREGFLQVEDGILEIILSHLEDPEVQEEVAQQISELFSEFAE